MIWLHNCLNELAKAFDLTPKKKKILLYAFLSFFVGYIFLTIIALHLIGEVLKLMAMSPFNEHICPPAVQDL